ncbi:MAG: type I-C CRISPR-associated protein Cas5c, partial [Lachnospiraceae bacterium]
MGYGIKLEVWGDYALFTRPEMKVERVSYDVLTPSAARGLVEAIYWKPAIKWVIDKISVCNPIMFTNIRRNEVSSKILASSVKSVMNGKKADLYIDTTADRQQRAAMVLKNVRYIIEAHFELTDLAGEGDTKEKHYNIILRRIRKGQCYHMPCFGCREFIAYFKEAEENQCSQPISETRDLGFMLYDM